MSIAQCRNHWNAILSDDNGFIGEFAGEAGELLLCLGNRELFGHKGKAETSILIISLAFRG
jgi:hypothetical protein